MKNECHNVAKISVKGKKNSAKSDLILQSFLLVMVSLDFVSSN